ncbi:hypothetical protein F2Q68_00011868 [Brassica cretica]|uniref:Uncharacterized protein n=1 Tax=Brassica cretica TaxID=69181 RepID=A0A8S9KW50_BRACR|nr:hypothetical protein F2Q68_00011868 [Brassica cretica]
MTRSVIFFFTVSLLLLLAAVSAIASSGNVTSGFSYGGFVSGVTVGECITAAVEDEEGVEAVVRRILQQQRRKLSYKTLQKQQSCNGKIAAFEQLTRETHLALTTTDANPLSQTRTSRRPYDSRSPAPVRLFIAGAGHHLFSALCSSRYRFVFALLCFSSCSVKEGDPDEARDEDHRSGSLFSPSWCLFPIICSVQQQ